MFRHPVKMHGFSVFTGLMIALSLGQGCLVDTVNVDQDVTCSSGDVSADGVRVCEGGVWVFKADGLDMDVPDSGSDMCTPESDVELCTGEGLACGQATIADRCGVMRTVDCGACGTGESCESNVCEPLCEGENAGVLCTRLGAQCGDIATTDTCGNSRQVSCGECQGAQEVCTDDFLCECIPKTEVEICGDVTVCGLVTTDNGCGTEVQVDCGGCDTTSGEFECIDNTCTCTPETDNAFCGRAGAQCGMVTAENNCGEMITVDCGGCSDGTCQDDFTCPTCQPFDDEALCSNAGLGCGEQNIPNNCGDMVTVNCGGCSNDRVCDVSAGVCECPEPTCSGVECGSVGNACGNSTVCPDTCNATTEQCSGNACICKPETNQELCSVNGAVCGSITVDDRCGTRRTVSCGACGGGEVCTGANVCCSPVSDADLCSANGAVCGSITVQDNCGSSRTVSCGGCGADEVCSNNACVCPTPSCSGVACGTVTNACGNSATCSNTCNATTEQCSGNSCVCKPETDQELCTDNAAVCGSITVSDRCGVSRSVSCGTCSGADEVCSGNACVCPAPSCSGVACGSVSNACGNSTICPDTCDAMTEQCSGNTCECKPETDQELCVAEGAQCGSITVTDRCGSSRTVDCTTAQGMCDASECAVKSSGNDHQCCASTDISAACESGDFCGEAEVSACGGTIVAADCSANMCDQSVDPAEVCDSSVSPSMCCTPSEPDLSMECSNSCVSVQFDPGCGLPMESLDCEQHCIDGGGTCNTSMGANADKCE